MSAVSTPIFKHLAMADISCLIPNPAISVCKIPYSIISIPKRPIKFQQLSCSTPSFSFERKKFSAIVARVAQNPETQILVEEEEGVWENQELDVAGALIFDLGGEGAEIVEAVGEVNGEVYSEPSEEAKIYVGNLPYDIDSQELAKLFDQAGIVEIAEVIMNRDTNQSRGFGFVTMSTVEETEKAVEMFHGQTVNGRMLTVNKAAPKGSRVDRPPRISSDPATRIYVGNLPWDVDSAGLGQIFSKYGNVVDARVVSDRETNRSRGFGFVTMSSESEMNDAIAALDGETMNGRQIKVNVAEERPRRSSF